MSATYNWAYKPGVTNKYGFVIPAGADDARPSGFCYVALFGNDVSGNGSRQRPYRTIMHARAVIGDTTIFILGSGTYREAFTSTISNMVGDGDVVIDQSFTSTIPSFDYPAYYNIKFIGNGSLYINNGNGTPIYYDCIFSYCSFKGGAGGNIIHNCIVSNFGGLIDISGSTGDNLFTNNTFYKCQNVRLGSSVFANERNTCLFSDCNISVTTANPNLQYSLMYNCNFRFNASAGTGGASYPSVPTGYTSYTDIVSMRTDFLAAFPVAINSWSGCVITSPLFNNAAIGDYTLSFTSPAKNLSYLGTYVGARSIAQGLKIRTVESEGDFDFSTAVNVTIADDSITLTDPTQDAVIETNVIENSLGRQLKSIPIVGFNADRNGQYIDSISDLDTITKDAGETLTIPASYLVEVGAIIYNSAIYTAGERFTTVAGQTTFTTASAGVLREILEAPQRHTIEMKLGDVQPFTTEAFNHFEPGITPTTNNVGDSRIGAIIRGNGDPAYVRGSTVEFPVNSKYIKIRFTIRANNLKP